MNTILVALLIIIAIASIAVLVWFLDAKFNSLYARLNDLQMPGNGLEEPSQDQSASPPSVSWQETESQLNVSFSPSILAGPSNNYGFCRINSTLKTDTAKPEAPETEEAREMAGVAPVSLYEKRAMSTYWKRKADGVCAHCGKTPAKEGRVLCAKCNRTNNIRQRARYKERIEAGE